MNANEDPKKSASISAHQRFTFMFIEPATEGIEVIHQLVIDGFRGFPRFEVRGLGRVNLLVGANNCGKTSILEAIQIFGSSGDPSSLWQVTSRRGERVDTTDSRRMVAPEADICHLFYGHEIDIGSAFKIVAYTSIAEETLTVTVAERSRQRQLFEEPETDSDEDDVIQDPNWMLDFEGSGVSSNPKSLPLSIRGGITNDDGSGCKGAHPRFQLTACRTVCDLVPRLVCSLICRFTDAIRRQTNPVAVATQSVAAQFGDVDRSTGKGARNRCRFPRYPNPHLRARRSPQTITLMDYESGQMPWLQNCPSRDRAKESSIS